MGNDFKAFTYTLIMGSYKDRHFLWVAAFVNKKKNAPVIPSPSPLVRGKLCE
jgi:hypothetical protein